MPTKRDKEDTVFSKAYISWTDHKWFLLLNWCDRTGGTHNSSSCISCCQQLNAPSWLTTYHWVEPHDVDRPHEEPVPVRNLLHQSKLPKVGLCWSTAPRRWCLPCSSRRSPQLGQPPPSTRGRPLQLGCLQAWLLLFSTRMSIKGNLWAMWRWCTSTGSTWLLIFLPFLSTVWIWMAFFFNCNLFLAKQNLDLLMYFTSISLTASTICLSDSSYFC